MEIHQINIKGAYMNRSSIIYMQQPPGYSYKEHLTNYIYWLQKTLYGLKQSGRHWYQILMKIMVNSLGFTWCKVNQAVLFKWEMNGGLTIVVIHIDGFMFVTSMLVLVADLKKQVWDHVEVTDLGELHWLLGIEVKRDRESHIISLSQWSYIVLPQL